METEERPSEDGEAEHRWVDRLAASIIEQMKPSVPDGVAVFVEGGGGELHIRMEVEQPRSRRLEHCFGSIAAEVDDLPRIARVRLAVQALLDNLQDFVVLQTKTPWPGTGTTQPMPTVEITGNRVDAWFGDDRSGSAYPRVSVELGAGWD